MDGEWAEGRRTDGIAVMEVPVYDPSDRKRKSHERRRDERARNEKRRELAKGGKRERDREIGRTNESKVKERQREVKEKAWRR